MTASGVVFALSGNYWVLLAAAIIGVISPSGNEIGPYRAIEESTLAHLTKPELRGDVFAWYSLFGFAGAALGMMACGWLLHGLRAQGWDIIDAYRAAFWVYAALGMIKFLMICGLSQKVEAEKRPKLDGEERPLLANESVDEATEGGSTKKGFWAAILPDVSRESVDILVKLCILFAFDSFASGLAPL